MSTFSITFDDTRFDGIDLTAADRIDFITESFEAGTLMDARFISDIVVREHAPAHQSVVEPAVSSDVL